MAEGAEVVEDFYGVYLLYCINPQYKGSTYIGFTVDPNRRIKQHNRGVKSGGAYRTSYRGPWEMVLIIHGFPNDISALRFEWAWQHPGRSRRLRDLGRKKPREQKYDFCLRVVAHMLRTKPWSRLPLTVRWLKQQYMKDFPAGMEPPVHMPISYGPVKPAKVMKPVENKDIKNQDQMCVICERIAKQTDIMRCLSVSCPLISHVRCLADHILQEESSGMILPLEGSCPSCGITLLWGDLVRLKRGCYQQSGKDDNDHWAESLSQVT
ncbi:structure-specific endonuclease subunit slx1 isoform X2 [Panulirus ornatus]